MLKFKTSEERTIWFTSDTHYNHKNIVRGVSSWPILDECRNFETIEDMNEMLVSRLNERIDEDDVLFFLGDWSFGGFDKIEEFREKLLVKELHFIIGNHDHHVANDKNGIRSIFTSVNDYLKIQVDNQIIILSHYPIISWQDAGAGAWMVHGHTHGTLPDKETLQWLGGNIFMKSSKMLDVGMDAVYKRTGIYAPMSFEDINARMVMAGHNELIYR